MKQAKEFFNVEDVIIYNGEYIPASFNSDSSLDSIIEIKEEIKENISLLKNSNFENEDIYDESFEYDPEKKYFYIDKEYADTKYKSKIVSVFDLPLKNPSLFFQDKVYCYVGNNIPYYISVENNIVREATEYEKYIRGQKQLVDGEYVNGKEISLYDVVYEYIDENGKKKNKSRQQLMLEKIITLENEKEKARKERERAFKALDLYDKAVLRGDVKETIDDKQSRDEYRQAWLKLPNNYSDVNIPIEDFYPIIPTKIKYFY